MNSPVSAVSYLDRAKGLLRTKDKASLFYAALELRCGIEARLKEHAAVAAGVSKSQAAEWEIKKLARTLEAAFGLGDSILMVFVTMEDGRACQFMYAPVGSRLQDIGKRCGDYLHAIDQKRVSQPNFWREFRALLVEGCGLLELACNSEILRPTVQSGIHFALDPEDPRTQVIQDLIAGKPGNFSTATLVPAGPLTYYPADEDIKDT